MIDLFFIVDIGIYYLLSNIGLNMYTGYYKKGILVMRRRHVMWRYIKTWFFLDLIATFPYSWLLSEATHSDVDALEQEYSDEYWGRP